MTAWTPQLITVDVGGTLGIGRAPTLTARLVAASPLPSEKARTLLRTTLHTAPVITQTVVREVCDALLIPPSAFPRRTDPAPLELHPGALDALCIMSQYAPIVTLSNVSAVDADTKVLRNRLRPWVNDCYTSCRLGYAKPDPRAFHAAATRWDVLSADTLHIGDHWECDVVGAAMAGARPVWIAPGTAPTGTRRSQGRDVVAVADLTAAAEYVRHLFRPEGP